MQVKKQQLELNVEHRLIQTGKEVSQRGILLLCLFNLCAEYIMQNAHLSEAEPEIKIARRNIKIGR